jgi:hypothetical protein
LIIIEILRIKITPTIIIIIRISTTTMMTTTTIIFNFTLQIKFMIFFSIVIIFFLKFINDNIYNINNNIKHA